MNAVVIAAAVLVFASQGEAPPPLPEPPPPEVVDNAPPPPPDVEVAPAVPAPAEKSAEPTPPKAAPAGDPGGLNPFVTALLQCGAGCLTASVVNLLGVIPFIGGLLVCFGGPIIVGTVETVVGDLLGDSRGTLLWTVLGAYGGMAISAVTSIISVGIGMIFFGAGYAALLGAILSGQNPAVALGGFFAGYIGAVVIIAIGAGIGLLLYPLIPALVYLFTSEKKQAGDGEFRFPGFTAPAHKGQEASRPLRLGETRQAMAF